MALAMAAAFEARSGSNHSSPNGATRVVPLHDTAKKEAQDFMLVSSFFDESNQREATSETEVVARRMTYIEDRPDPTSPHITWSYYKFAGNDARLSGEYFLYAVRGKFLYCRHSDLMQEYRDRWMADGHQRLRKRPPPPDDQNLEEEEEDGVVTFRRINEGDQVDRNLEVTRDLLASLSTNDTSASADHIESFQDRPDDDEGNRTHRRENNRANNRERDYSHDAQRLSDERLDLSVDSRHTPEPVNNLPGNVENTTGGLDGAAGSDRQSVPYYNASTFEGMGPDFLEKSPRSQKNALKEADGFMRAFCENAQQEKADMVDRAELEKAEMAERCSIMLVKRDREIEAFKEQIKVLQAAQGTLVEAAKAANRARNNSTAPPAVRPKDNSAQQSRQGSRDRAAGASQVPPRRNKRHTSVDGSSSDNGNMLGLP